LRLAIFVREHSVSDFFRLAIFALAKSSGKRMHGSGVRPSLCLSHLISLDNEE